MFRHPRIHVFTALAGLAVSSSALAQSFPTDAEVCQRTRTTFARVSGKIMACDDFPEGKQREEPNCEEEMSRCKPTTKRWFMQYLDELERSFSKIPQCRGKLADYMRDTWGPAAQEAFDAIGTIPVDENCFLVGQYKLYVQMIETMNRFPTIRRTRPRKSRPPANADDPRPPRKERVEPAQTVETSRPFFLDRDAGPPRRLHISAVGFAGGYSGTAFGVGGLIGVPLSSSLFPQLNDAIYFEGGARALFVNFSRFGLPDTTATFFQLTGGARWDVHFTPEWSAYWALRLGALVAFDQGAGGIRWGSAIGGHWRFAESLGLRVEVDGSNFGSVLTVGATFFL